MVVSGFIFREIEKSDITIRIVNFVGAEGSALTHCAFYKCGYHRYRHNVFLEGGSTRCEVAYNYLEDIVGQGIGVQGDADPELISSKVGGSIIRWNTFIDNAPGKNLVLRGGRKAVVENNYISSGIRAYGEGHTIRNNVILGDTAYGIDIPGGIGPGLPGQNYPETWDCLIEGNLVLNSSTRGIRLGGSTPYIRDNTVRNNRIKMNFGTMYYLANSNGGGMVFSGNIGAGSATLATSNIPVPDGVEFGPVDPKITIPPMQHKDVGPCWMGGPCNGEAESSFDPTYLRGEKEAFFGKLDDAGYPWVFSFDHGWWYSSSVAGQFFFYDLAIAGWLYANPSFYPWLYSYSHSDWLFYWEPMEPSSTRWFFPYGGIDCVEYGLSR